MAFSIDEILTPATREEVLEELLAIAASLGMPTTSWQEGSPVLTLLTVVAEKMSNLTEVSVEIAKGGFGDLLPSDDWADLWAQSRFAETRVAATAAAGYVTLGNASASNYVLAAGDLTVAHATTGKTYRNVAPITILAAVGLANVAVAADETGTGSNAAPGTITTVVSSLVGVTCTNPASVLGTDKETTEALVSRCYAKLGSFSPDGPKGAYDYAARTPAYSPTAVPITRTRTVASEATGTLNTYLATAAGAPSVADVAIVQTAFDTYAEPWTTTATAVAATEHVVNVAYQVWVKGSQLTPAAIQLAIETALAEWFATLDIGGYVIPPDTGAVYTDALQQVIGSATQGILRVSITTPSANVTLTENEVAVLGTITPTVTIL